MILSILIATMPKRQETLNRLLRNLRSQSNADIEIITDDSMDYNVGVKRQLLLEKAKGNYIVYIDDDDQVAKDYISKILEASKSNADCMAITGIITTNGLYAKKWYISKKYGRWFEKNNIYYRTPNHISPVKRTIALQAGFPPISQGEDAEYSNRILPLLNTEVRIEGNLYFYQYRNRNK